MNDGAPIRARDWFTFDPTDTFAPSIVGMESWLDAPAGKHGFVRMRGRHLAFEDGTPVKFWGVNICNARVAPASRDGRRWAKKLAKFGVNAVRFHKFTYYGTDRGLGAADMSTLVDERPARRWDSFVAELRARGIYTGWSHIYGHHPRPGDRNRLLAYDEVCASLKGHLRGSTVGLVNFAPDLQNLSIELTVNLLNRRNHVTGLRYADDPALAYVELQNEDDIFFPTTMSAVNACPTYKKLFCEQFSGWLRRRYGSQAGLARAWGKRALDAYPEFQIGEHVDKGTVYPIAHFWYFSPEGLESQQRERGTRRRLLDTARFLYETQNRFYRRYVKGIRATGYRGCIVGSCWQAGSGVSHLYNLHADYLAGLVDRHNYFGGGSGHDLHTGEINNDAMVRCPGTGLLSTGFQQVANRPFFLSEWISRIPNEWVAEGPPLVAAYGLGLQGWNGSFEFASNTPHHPSTIQNPNVYSADSPSQLLSYPAIARMIYRGDLLEGAVVAGRAVHVESLASGRMGFVETVKQKGDQKAVVGDTPFAALAAGRVVLSFVKRYARTPPPDLSRYLEGAAAIVTANSGQLRWDGDTGYSTIDTAGTKALIGFAPTHDVQLGCVRIRLDSPFAVLFVSSLDRDTGVDTARRLFITALARVRNSGMRYSADGKRLERVGTAPIRMEGVRAELTLMRNAEPPRVFALDIAGCKRTCELDVARGDDGTRVRLDGGRYETVYYEVSYRG